MKNTVTKEGRIANWYILNIMNLNINLGQLSYVNKLQLYMVNMKPAMNRRALFSDGTEEYRYPMEPMANDTVRIRFRTARYNASNVILHVGENNIKMDIFKTDNLFDYYEAFVQLGTETISYYFEVISGITKCFYNKFGVVLERNPYYDFTIAPGFKTPDWAKGAVFYQIFVDRFYNGDTTNDVETNEYSYIGEGTVKVDDWYKYPAAMGVREFYGGDLQGVMDKLDYLQNLGIEVIYFNPIFVSPSNHKYDIQDYDYIDPHFGKIVSDEGELLGYGDNDNTHATRYINRVTNKDNLEASNELFAELVRQAHERGIRVILDGVFNHCGSFNKWLDREKIYENEAGYEKGAYVSADSPYRSFFKFYDEYSWPYNHSYDGWWGHDTLPKLNYEESEILCEYIMKIAKKWVSPPYNCDGWRLDVAADLGHSAEYNHRFWQQFRNAVKEANPEAIILAEHYGDPGAWLLGNEWDTVMNYDAFMEPLTWFLTGMEKHSDEFRGDLLGNNESFFGAMDHHMSRFNEQSLLVAMNELSNHDHSRFLTRTNRRVGRTAQLGPEEADRNINKAILMEAVVIQMTWPGAPTIYYGDECGLCGWTDPDNRRTYPWGREDQTLIDFHREVISIHKSNQCLKTGSYKGLYGSHKIIAYARFNSRDAVIVAVNSNYEEQTIRIPVWEAGVKVGSILETLLITTENTYDMPHNEHIVDAGTISIKLPPVSSIIMIKK